ncbi:MAG: dTDP-4-dehydrorhamnose reductase [Aquabacterium sp.]|jgi:dTDP-4-dehydrorhamnose reductase|uniref:dTDP-4-dehydrorhamnose reductase n=1 Tax=Aquabacterium sp. TaxID=1872578 RepID=UPI003BAFA08D
MNILLLGKGGQVGWELQRALAPLGHITAHDIDTADFTQPDQVATIVRAVRPQVIVNAAAHTAVDKAESEPDVARLINAATPGAIAKEAAQLNALLVHYSTDYVFDGTGHAPRDENASTAPLSVYGQTKLEGEQQIIASGCQHLILRTSWVYAARGGNFAKTMLRLASERDQLKVINDQIGSPTGADLLADVTAHAVRTLYGSPALAGLYHLVADGETSWYDYARYVIEWARKQGQAVRVQPEDIIPVPTTEYPTPAKRPLNSRLSTAKLKQAFGLQLQHWQQGVERMLIEHLGK